MAVANVHAQLASLATSLARIDELAAGVRGSVRAAMDEVRFLPTSDAQFAARLELLGDDLTRAARLLERSQPGSDSLLQAARGADAVASGVSPVARR